MKTSTTPDGINNSNLSFIVSHTTDDLIFQWLPVDKTPLAVDDGIQLPQLELINNKTGDCTSVYSTGISYIFRLRNEFKLGPKISFNSYSTLFQETSLVWKSYSSSGDVLVIISSIRIFQHV